MDLKREIPSTTYLHAGGLGGGRPLAEMAIERNSTEPIHFPQTPWTKSGLENQGTGS
ncbi:hypothetical protein J2129_001035 [Methanofollis sp. W23]|nr:hypothetical protein [Methanofollis sp. W23]